MAYGKVLSDGLPLQETPSGRVLFQLKRGERFEIIEVRDGMRVKRWLRVRCYGRNGWVAEFDGRTGAMLVEYDALPPKLHVKMPRDFEQPNQAAAAARLVEMVLARGDRGDCCRGFLAAVSTLVMCVK